MALLEWRPPQRINMTIMTFFGLVLAYAMRNSLAIAITVIVRAKPAVYSTEYGNLTICPIDSNQDADSTSSSGVYYFR